MDLEEGCICFDYKNLSITNDDNEYYITNNKDLEIHFEFENEAEFAIDVIAFYKFDTYCTINESNSFAYFLSDGDIPTGEFTSIEDCLRHDPDKMRVELTQNGNYTVVSQNQWHYSGETEQEAIEILEILRKYESSYSCYVGRPITKMHYLRK